MYTILMALFIGLCFFLALFVLLQQGKGDLGVSSMATSQMLFGGSGGQNFFEKATWIMGALFIAGSLGLTMLKSREKSSSILEGEIVAPQQIRATQAPTAADSSDEQPLGAAEDDAA